MASLNSTIVHVESAVLLLSLYVSQSEMEEGQLLKIGPGQLRHLVYPGWPGCKIKLIFRHDSARSAEGPAPVPALLTVGLYGSSDVMKVMKDSFSSGG